MPKYEKFQDVVVKIGKPNLVARGRLQVDRSLRNGTQLEKDADVLKRARGIYPESQIEAMLTEYGIQRAGEVRSIANAKLQIVRADDGYGNEVLASPNPFQQEGMYYLPETELVILPKNKIAPKEPVWERSAAQTASAENTGASIPAVPAPATATTMPAQIITAAPAPAAPAIDYAALARQQSAEGGQAVTAVVQPVAPQPVMPEPVAAPIAITAAPEDMATPTIAPAAPVVIPASGATPVPVEDVTPVGEVVHAETVTLPAESQVYPTLNAREEETKPRTKRMSIAMALIELKIGNVQPEEMQDPKLDQTLLRRGRITADQAAQAQALSRGLNYVDVNFDPPNPAIAHLLDENTSRSERVFPYQLKEDGTFIVLTDVPAKEAIIRTKVAERSGKSRIEVQVTSTPAIDKLIRDHYTSATTLQALNQELETSGMALPEVSLDGSENAVSNFVYDLVLDAAGRNASDIHIEPTLTGLQVRFRIDGKLRPAIKEAIAVGGMANIVRVVKLMARMDVGNNRLPQDNRISLKIGSRRLNLRVSSMPQTQGHEKIVMRILKEASDIPEVENLGMNEQTLARFKDIIRKPEGLFLVTGPTGSGKSFTLYSALKRIATPDRNTQTLEDPIEYELPHINQSQVNAETGYTFAAGLRAAMRQDPDILLLGEIRDAETATISLSMANTGHQVLSTLHTISAASAIQKLRDFGVENYNISPTIQGVMTQRLVRKLCPHCSVPAPLPERVKTILDQAGVKYPEDQYRTVNPEGCRHCEKGRKGRMPIHELMTITPEIRELINKGASVSELETTALKQGMLSLTTDGYLKVAQGLLGIEDLESTLNEIADEPTFSPTQLQGIQL